MLCIHFILHNSSFRLAAQRTAVGFIDRLDGLVAAEIVLHS